MRKIFLIVLASLVGFGCDSERSSTSPEANKEVRSITNRQIVVRNKVVVPATVVVRDTDIVKKSSSVLLGKIIQQDTKGSVGAVVCSEKMNKCVKTNSSGVYRLEKVTVAARSFSGNDTMTTPENIPLEISSGVIVDTAFDSGTVVISDTTTSIDSIIAPDSSVVIVDSIIVTDTIRNVDTIKISVTIDSMVPTPIIDTLEIINNGTVIGEIVIDSWGCILPPNYIVQRNISAVDSTWDNSIDTVEAVYFVRGDSVAKVVSLGNVGRNYAGFVYTLYNDSSFKKDDKVYNLFIRAKNNLGSVIVKTEVETFSERYGDIPNKILKTKVGVPEYKISPNFVPAARNNEKLKNSVVKYNNKPKVNWIGDDAMPGVFKNNSREYVGYTKFDYDSLGVDSVSFNIVTESDSIRVPVIYTKGDTIIQETILNTKTYYKMKLRVDKEVGMFVISPVDDVDAIISEVRFYFKD